MRHNQRSKSIEGPTKYGSRKDDSRNVAKLLAIGLLIASSAFGLMAQQTSALPRRQVLFVLDASGSMSLPFNGVSRMSAAQQMLREQVRKLPANSPVGLMAYGNGVLGCRSARVYNQIEPYSGRRIERIVQSMLSAGNTPLAYTLNKIRTQLLPRHPGLTIVVISDGAESCGGNPIVEAKLLTQAGATVHVIGLATGRNVSLQLRGVANAGGGRYRTVENDSDFRQAFEGTLGNLRNRRNFFVARKWGLRERPADPVAEPQEFVITAIRRRSTQATFVEVEVDFRFSQKGDDDYLVKIRAIPQPANQVTSIRVPNDETTIASDGASFYAARSGTGTAILEIPTERLLGGPIYMQGELWRTGNVPVAAALSNSLRLQ